MTTTKQDLLLIDGAFRAAAWQNRTFGPEPSTEYETRVCFSFMVGLLDVVVKHQPQAIAVVMESDNISTLRIR